MTTSITPLRVLLLEDRASDAELMLDELRDAGFEPDWERVDGETAYLARLDPSLDVILADCNLPQYTALGALTALQARGLDIPMIVVTGSRTDEEAAELLRRGAADYLLKDRLGRLGAAVRRAVAERQARAEKADAEAALRASEGRYREISELVTDYAFALRVEADGALAPDWITDSLVAVSGYTAEELIALGGPLALVHPGDRLRAETLWRALLAGEAGQINCRMLTRTGEVRWLRARGRGVWDPDAGRVVRVYGAAQDVTERHAADAARRETEARLESVLASLDDVVWSARAHDNQVLYVSPSVETVYGYSVADFTSSPDLWATVVLPEDAEEIRASLITLWQTGVSEHVHRIRRPDGAVRWLHTRCWLVSDTDGAASRIDGITRDVTNLKEADAALHEVNARLQEALNTLRRSEQQLVQQERLRALGEMASGIAHDFNNALAPMLGYTELLLARPGLLDDRTTTTEFLQLVNQGAQDAAHVVSRLREFYRPPADDEALGPVQLGTLVEAVLAITHPRWHDQALAQGRVIEVITALEPLPDLAADESALREALTNLIFNAVDALPTGGTITVRTRAEADAAVVEIADTGMGMTEDVRRRCLEPFFSTKGDHGTGLGLSMVYGIIQRHHGSIDIHSVPSEGTTFVLRFPLRAPASTGPTPVAAAPPDALHVLLVDDEASIRRVTAAYLACEGHSVETADNGTDGLARFQAGTFDLVITDHAMPGMSGEQFARAIKAVAPHTPVLMMTGFGDVMERAAVDRTAVDHILCKPATLAGLRDAVLQTLATAGPGARNGHVPPITAGESA